MASPGVTTSGTSRLHGLPAETEQSGGLFLGFCWKEPLQVSCVFRPPAPPHTSPGISVIELGKTGFVHAQGQICPKFITPCSHCILLKVTGVVGVRRIRRKISQVEAEVGPWAPREKMLRPLLSNL